MFVRERECVHMLFMHQKFCFKLKFYTNVNILILTDKLGLFCLNILLHCVCACVCVVSRWHCCFLKSFTTSIVMNLENTLLHLL